MSDRTTVKGRERLPLTKGGKKVFYRIKDIERVNVRRREIGLPPLKVWANENGIEY